MLRRLWAQVGTLRALSTLCAEREASRKQVVDAGAMPHIVRALDHSSPEVSGGHSPALGCGRKVPAAVVFGSEGLTPCIDLVRSGICGCLSDFVYKVSFIQPGFCRCGRQRACACAACHVA